MIEAANSIGEAFGGIILCGGQSRRMGVPKSDLPIGSESMLERITKTLRSCVQPVVVVRGAGEAAEIDLAGDVVVVEDRISGRGPLEGLAVGLGALAPSVDLAFVASCDMPLLTTAFMRDCVSAMQAAPPCEVYAVRDEQRLHPFPGIYRVSCLPVVEQHLAQRKLSMSDLLSQLSVHEMAAGRLSEQSRQALVNVNHWEEYVAALRLLGMQPDAETLRRWQSSHAQQ